MVGWNYRSLVNYNSTQRMTITIDVQRHKLFNMWLEKWLFLCKVSKLYDGKEVCIGIRKQDKEGLLVNECIEEFGLDLESLTSSTEYWSM